MISWTAYDIYFLVEFVLGVVSLVLTAIVNIKIYLTVQLHKNQIQALQGQQEAQTDEMAHFARFIKSAVSVFYVYVTFVVCYLPYFISVAVFTTNGPNISLKRFSLFSLTLIYLNSSLNPVIYCWKMRDIQHAIMDILRNMSSLRNRAPHLS